MIRQLRRLTHAVPAFGPGVSAIAIYSEVTPLGMRDRCAAESGFEGVACVDDTARLASLYIALWRREGADHWRSSALEALAFVRAMQRPDGSFVNFIADWSGRQNTVGKTSADPCGPWLARAAQALAEAAAAFDDTQCAAAYERCAPWLEIETEYLDIRAVALLASLAAVEWRPSPVAMQRAEGWAAHIFESRFRGMLPDQHSSDSIHLWGHLQECALARAGVRFGRPDWIEAARMSAQLLLVPAVELGFAAPTSIAFEVSCVVRGLSAVAEATGDQRYNDYAELGRAWFSGRNEAHSPVYDRHRGMVYDGIDSGRINKNSGAESNIEAGLALFGDLSASPGSLLA